MESPENAAERRRIQEVAKYYCTTQFPLNENGLTPLPDPQAPCGTSSNEVILPALDPIRPPQISPEPALTGLAQLGALKLNCRRAFISVIDHNTQYLLAEATKSVSLLNQHEHNEGDALYLGVQSLPLQWGVCPSTIKAFTDTDARFALSTPNVTANLTRYIVYDFTKEPDIKDRPYVIGWPFMRFYAEVPLRSPSGYVIGSYCVVDDRPRASFSDREVAIMQEVSDIIGNQLHYMRMREDYERAERLMKGLSHFVEGQTSISAPSNGELESAPLRHPSARPRTPHTAKRLLTDVVLISENDRVQNMGSVSAASPRHGYSAGHYDTTKKLIQTVIDEEAPVPHIDSMDQKSKEQSSADAVKRIGRHASLVPTSIQETFRRASNLIRESMDLCGVIFFDAYLNDQASRTRSRQPGSSPFDLALGEESLSSDDELMELDLLGTLAETGQQADRTLSKMSTVPRLSTGKTSNKLCETLGCSTRSQTILKESNLALPEALLQSLSKKYPHGHIFNSQASEHFCGYSENLADGFPEDGRSRKRRKVLRKEAEASLLFDIFPEARSVIFFPLWDSHKSRWYAGSLGWTTDPKRALQSEEITYLAAFGNSIMSEVSRLEAVATDRAKSDFISNISHDLRSPLHGILASAELLQELSTGYEQDGLIEMVNSCGRTLLDTMNHLLDYAKINNFSKSKNTDSALTKNGQFMTDQMGLVSSFNLGELVEEVVEAVYTGHNFQQKMAANFKIGANNASDQLGTMSTSEDKNQSSAAVSVVLEIDNSVNQFFTSEAGAWRRIVMNIFGNALKYTTSGYIKVAVRAVESGEMMSQKRMVRLSISDTGKGISEEYLKNRLYTPFAQEDNLALGAGLGLSIVQQIVITLGGTVAIESQLGKGTSVTVSIPLDMDSSTKFQYRGLDLDALSSRCRGLNACFIGFEMPANYEDVSVTAGIPNNPLSRSAAITTSLTRSMDKWFDLETQYADDIRHASANIFVVEQGYLDQVRADKIRYQEFISALKTSSVIVLSAITPPQRQRISKHEFFVEYMSQPFGPAKIAKALRSCLEFASNGSGKPVQDSKNDFKTAEVQTEAGLGTQRYLSLPTPPCSLESPESPLAPPQGSTESRLTTNNDLKILLVDDNDINLKILVTCIKKLHCQYEIASDGQQALDKYMQAASTAKFDYVLMDVSMPVMDGLTSTRLIRAFERDQGLSPTKIIALTGLASAKAQRDALSSGVDLFLTKPVQLRNLKSVIGLG